MAWFFMEFTPKIKKGVLYLELLVTNISTATIGETLNVLLNHDRQ
jgi:hypothetical protein